MISFIPWEENGVHSIVHINGIIAGQGDSLEEALEDAYQSNGVTREEVAL